LASVAGLYWNPSTDTVRRVYVKDGKLIYSRAPNNESELAPLGDNRFVMLGVRNRVEITFKPTRRGGPFRMFFAESGGKPSVQEPVNPAAYQPRQLDEFAGEYFSPEVGATYTITPQGDKLLFRTGNWGDFLLSPRFADSFANPDEMGSLVFTRDQRHRVNGFVIRSGKVRNLRFDKMKWSPHVTSSPILREGRDELQADGRRHFERVPREVGLAGLRVEAEDVNRVRVLIRGQKVSARRVYGEVARSAPARRLVTDECERARAAVNLEDGDAVVPAVRAVEEAAAGRDVYVGAGVRALEI
jgi:hypothetical protein